MSLPGLTVQLAAGWWLPPNHAEHGQHVDRLFGAVFWLSAAIFVAVHVALLLSLVLHRHRPGRARAWFIHGNNRCEVLWTIVPAVILAVLSFWSIRVWDNYQFPPDPARGEVVRVMVIGQQFKWNVIYPGPDGQIGRYLVYPKPTDALWPGNERFRGTGGPADLPADKAVDAINAYIDQVNPLGKDFDDPAGRDDDWRDALNRDLIVPVGRTVEVFVGSRDVIHDFAVPKMRVKIDTPPGMIGRVTFTPTRTSEHEPGGAFDIVCEELCGAGHYTMQGRLLVVDGNDARLTRIPNPPNDDIARHSADLEQPGARAREQSTSDLAANAVSQ
jgi:cytochrome c oxidase subunit 2